MTRKLKGLLIAVLALMLVACNSEGGKPKEAGGKEDTELHVAMAGQPPTIDPAMTAGSTTKQTARHIFETLLAVNSNYLPVPMLAESYDISDDRKTYTFILREGVKFHNGKEMTSEDVVASMNRWISLSPVAKEAFGDSKFESDGDYKVVVQLEQPVFELLDVLASTKQFAGIMPKEVVENAEPDGVKEYIGTGPFKFVEWKQDQYLKLTKFEDYQAVETEADGMSGKKEALVTDLYFDFVADSSTRLAGLQTGEYDVSISVPLDSYEQMKVNPNIKIYKDLYGVLSLIYNKEAGIFSDVNMRRAVNAAINPEEVLLAAVTTEDLYELDNGYMHQNQKNWYSDAGKEEYNLVDADLAKEYLEKAGYNGEEVVLLTTRDFDHQYNAAVVTKEQLEKVGINVRLDVYDFATLLEKEKNPENWDLLTISVSTVTTPSQVLYLTYNQHGFTKDENITGLLKDIKASTSAEESQKIFSELQEYSWKEYLPVSNYGYHYGVFTSTDKVEGMTTFDGPILWNTKVYK